jgi:GTP-binding protein
MAFVDEIRVSMKAGHGGDGVVRWRREKFIPKGGPAGGDGGRGGNIYVTATRSLHTLAKYAHQKEFSAGNGNPGGSAKKHGADGEDLTIALPVGSVLTNIDTGTRFSLDEEGQTFLLLKGGAGGLGNEQFKSSVNQAPKKATPGKPGEEASFKIELELVADVGFVGYPNAGKSSLLNTLTNATAKVGDYAFTTLDPNLGDFYGYILADIPGLIEGASEGKGLGTKFLKHIRRTKKIIHLISFENELSKAGGMMKAYKEIRAELEKFDPTLAKKEEILLLTKTDVVEDEDIVAKKVKEFEKLKKPVFAISLFDDSSVKAFSKELPKLLQK